MSEKLGLFSVPELAGFHAGTGRVVAQIVSAEADFQALEKRIDGLAIGGYPRGIGSESGGEKAVHELDLLKSRKAFFGVVDLTGRSGFGAFEPLLLFGEADLDVADALKVFGEFVGIVFAETFREMAGVIEDGVQDAFPLFEQGLS